MFASILISAAWLGLASGDSPAANTSASPAAAAMAVFADACTSCHDASDELDLSGNLDALTKRIGASGVPMVVPGKPESSYLVHKLGGSHPIVGDPMPLADDPLTAEERAAITQWIAAMPASSAPPLAATPASSKSAGEANAGAAVTSGVSGDTRTASGPKAFNGTHQINLPSTTPLGKRVLEMRVHHRFGRVGEPGDGNYLGLANGAVMSLGLAYGIVDSLDVLLRFTNSSKDWELGAKYVPLRQEAGMPLSFGVYASGEWLSVSPKIADNRFTGSAQAMASRLWWGRWATQAIVTTAFLTNHAKNPQIDDGNGPRAAHDRRMTLGVGLASTVYLDKKRRYGVDVEYNLPLPVGGRPDRFYFHGGDADPKGSNIGSWALGLSARVGLHFFQVFMTNTQAIHTNLVAPGGDTKNPFDPFGSFFLGFNLSRKWTL